MTKTVYLVIKAEVEVDDTWDEDDGEVAAEIGNNADYSVSIDNEKLKIVDTELLWSGDECPSEC